MELVILFNQTLSVTLSVNEISFTSVQLDVKMPSELIEFIRNVHNFNKLL